MKKQKLALTLMCMILSIAVLLTSFEGDAAAGMVGENAPIFTLKDMDGKNVSLADFKGKPVFLNFWATW